MKDSIANTMGLKPMTGEELQALEIAHVEFLKTAKRKWGGNSFGRPKGSKNLKPYPVTAAVRAGRSAAASKRNAGKFWVNNGKETKFTDHVPEGWTKGRKLTKVTNGV